MQTGLRHHPAFPGTWASTAPGQRLTPPGLGRLDFRCIASGGFGDPHNSYAHSMAWFQGALYVGTSRDLFALLRLFPPPEDPAAMHPWPVSVPDQVEKLDLRAQIWRWVPEAGKWKLVHVAPATRGRNGQPVPRDLGYRGMAVYQGRSDPAPALYVSGISSVSRGTGARLLRSIDGNTFSAVSEPGLGNPQISTLRALMPFDGFLYVSPTGAGKSWNASGKAIILRSADPFAGRWEVTCAPGFGDAENTGIFEMQVFNNCLYAGTFNHSTGYQVWKTPATGRQPCAWRRVTAQGAGRGNLNEMAMSMCVFNGALYVGSGIQNGGYDRTFRVGPAASELIRIHPDDTWDLIVGEPRLTSDGFKRPLSGFEPGFNNFFNGYFWRMASHDGCLYLGTFDWSVFLPYATSSTMYPWLRRYIDGCGAWNIVRDRAGFDLWRTADGEDWVPVTARGFGNPYNYGARTMLSTPLGLCIGTANPFGPEIAVPLPRGWAYYPNPRGGAEVWLGGDAETGDPADASDPIAVSDPLAAGGDEGDDVLDRINDKYDDEMYAPAARAYYGGTDFFNFGYWTRETQTQKQACENLMEELLRRIPRKRGTILDVACGKGATTAYLLKYYQPRQVIGINISEKQLEQCRSNAPGCSFRLMDATDLQFPDRSIENIICVEAAFHFNTREQFLREAYRVLKAGGSLVLSDILLHAWAGALYAHGTPQNYVADLVEYEQMFRQCGFDPVEVTEATEECLMGFITYSAEYLQEQLAQGQIGRGLFRAALEKKRRLNRCVSHYVLLSAGKPNVTART